MPAAARIMLISAVIFGFTIAGLSAQEAAPEDYRQWIAGMQTAERGPFARVLWFCNDGTTQPAAGQPCKERGGGNQHGEWSERTRALRDAGYNIATFLAGVDPESFVNAPSFRQVYGQLLVEKFLVRVDDGWIFRRAMFYRGAIQEEGERHNSQTLLEYMSSLPYWSGPGFLALRTGAQLLPHGSDDASIQNVRQTSASLADRDPGFASLRVKIHGSPDADDAGRVRDYAGRVADPELRAEYLDLAAEIDGIYRPEPLPETLEARADQYNRGPWLQELLRAAAQSLRQADTPSETFLATGELLRQLHDAVPIAQSASVRLQLLDLSNRVESLHFRAATELRPQLDSLSRAQLLELVRAALEAGYGTGHINARLLSESLSTLDALGKGEPPLSAYRQALHYLGRSAGWGSQALRMHFQEPMQKLAEIEPLSLLFIQDQLRGSPMFFLSQVLDRLQRDANRLAGVRHELFGAEVGSGLTALNPGLARGTLRFMSETDTGALSADGIYVLPETTSELPPVAGILTAGEGNPLSHVQLLARNLGIPNVVVADSLLPQLERHTGEEVLLAVSPGGVVTLSAAPPLEEAESGAPSDRGVRIEPDLDKLDLGVSDMIPLLQLRADDSGRIVGPKAAKLGQLRRHYPEAVARGVALPFGLFRERVLERPYPGDASGKSVLDWMKEGYAHLAALQPPSAEQAQQTEAFRAALYDIVLNTPLDASFVAELREALGATFGPGPLPGLFIRSDTNVEDLPGFTGAGLNLTLPNVVGIDALIEGIPRVWASPFTPRAFAWRQALMSKPEHVYTSVLLLESVPVEKSGVLVTQDLDSGDRNVLSVAVNEGIGGAVDGQAAESLRISLESGAVRVLATATAPWRRVLDPAGGLSLEPASGSDTVLAAQEIKRLVAFARNLPERFPPIFDDLGAPAPADVEFGFANGRLRLFQIRPFLENRAAQGSARLREMDARLSGHDDRPVPLSKPPGS